MTGKKVIYLFVVILAVIGVVLIMHSPYFAIKTIGVNGLQELSAEEVIKISGVQKGDNIFLIPGREVVNRLMENVRIKGVKLERRFPNGLVIVVNERPGLALFSKEDKLWELGEDGVILTTFQKDSTHPTLPSIEGVRFEVIGRQVEMSPGLKGALDLLKGIYPFIEEVQQVSYKPDDLRLTLSSGVLVYFGSPDNLQQNISVFQAIVERLGKITEVKYIDLRYTGKPVIQLK